MLRHKRSILIVAGLSIVGGIVGCRAGGTGGQGPLFFPAPPEKPRVQFLTWASGADQVEPGKGTFAQFILGDEPRATRAISKPYGLAAHDGAVYVCDTKGLCLWKLDFKNKKCSVVGAGGPGRLRKPINIAMDALGYKFVVDPERKQIVVFGPDDAYVTAHDVPAPSHPVDIALYENELYVLDNDESCQIVVLDRSTGQVLRTFGSPGGAPGQFKIPNSLCVGPDGHLYVSDTHNWRIQKLTREGTPVWAKGTPGYTLGSFGRPRGIRVGPDNIIYVVDGATEIVQMFDAEGNTLMRFGGPGNVPGALGLPATLAVDPSSVSYFQQYAHKDFKLDYLLFVTSQYGSHLVSVYGFGSFPEGYKLSESDVAVLPAVPMDKGIGPVSGEDAAEAPERMQEAATQPQE